jgi:hypothetical protein
MIRVFLPASRLAAVSTSFLLVAGCSGAAPPAATNADSKPLFVQSGPLKGARILNLAAGVNAVDIDGDGLRDVITVAWRENNNAHGYMLYSFLRNSATDSAIQRNWRLIPFEDSTNLNEGMRSGGGADCLLNDLAVLRPQAPDSAGLIVVSAARDFGESFADSAHVTFTEFRLKRNSDSSAGWPDVYFTRIRTTRSAGKYCDVDDALASEWGIPRIHSRE